MGLSWMAWTWPTAAFFIFILLALVTMGVWEWRSPGGNPRRGVLGLDTTRGDRLFISLLGSAFIFLAWLGIMGTLNRLFVILRQTLAIATESRQVGTIQDTGVRL
jgi:predicted small integral membrane protein